MNKRVVGFEEADAVGLGEFLAASYHQPRLDLKLSCG